MKIVALGEAAEARRLFEEEWNRRHGSAPPALYPDRPEDRLWREADEMMDAAWAKAIQNIGHNADYQRYLTQPHWAASSGWISCANDHVVVLADDYCPSAALVRFTAAIKWEAEQAAAILGAKAGLAYLRGI